MRLRYLSIPSLPPLKDIAITFGHEPILGRDCTIHFVVGVNGTGKSRLLRALTEIFLYLGQALVPPFPVTIAYDLGRNINSPDQEASQSISTIYYRYTGEHGKDSAYMAILDHIPLSDHVEWGSFHRFDWKQAIPEKPRPYHRRACLYNSSQFDGYLMVKSYLPQIVLAYTSGSPDEWKLSFMPTRHTWEENIDATFPRIEQDSNERLLLERPANWDSAKEITYQQRGEDHLPTSSNISFEKKQPPEDSIGLFIQPQQLKLVVCAVALSHVWNELKDDDTNDVTEARRESLVRQIDETITSGTHMGGMRDILNAVDWLWPVTIGLRIAFQPERFQPDETKQLLEKFYLISTKVLRDSEPSNTRMLFFDLLQNVQLPAYDEYDRKITLKSFMTILSGIRSEINTPAFGIFKQLQRLQQQGILEDITIGLQKRKLNADESGILLYDWLSDGERMFLGRMALFHLLKGSDNTLIILDEPETHFNDVWKREIVDIIDSGLRNDTSEIVLSTHSSISLSDVFDTEITLLKKDITNGTVYATHPSVHSFGASPDDILRDIFGAPESVGLRASEFLDLMLVVATNPEQTQRFWFLDRQREDQQATRALRQLMEFVLSQPGGSIFIRNNAQVNSEFEEYLRKTLRAVYVYTHQRRERVDIISALDVLQEQLGPGFYQFEFRRRLRALRKDSDAASH